MGRNNRLDTIKGVLIILVILGHLIGQSHTKDMLSQDVWTYIYTFHMPLFIFISGYFSMKKNDTSEFLRNITPIAISLVIFQAINVFAICILLHHSFELQYLVVPYWTLWYLLSLIFWRFMFQFTPSKLLNKPVLCLLMAFVLSSVCGLMPHGRLLSIQRTINFYPFFLIGYYMNNGIIKQKPWSNIVSYGIIIAVAIFIAIGFSPSNISVLLRGADHYSLSDIPVKIGILIVSTAMSISVFNVIIEQKWIAVIGKDSLLYYLYHGLLISFCFSPLMRHFGFPNGLLFLIIYCGLIVGIIYVMSKTKFFRWLINPLKTRK